jgi:DNA-binding NarL/FixJ family response regulator
MSRIRLFLVDDNLDFLDSVTRFLSTDPRFEIAGRALNGLDAVHMIPLLQPDVVLMDWAMPGMSGLEATREIKALPNPPRVVILTLYDNAEYRAAAASARADGFVAKSDLSKLTCLIGQLCPESVGHGGRHHT